MFEGGIFAILFRLTEVLAAVDEHRRSHSLNMVIAQLKLIVSAKIESVLSDCLEQWLVLSLFKLWSYACVITLQNSVK